MYTNPKYMTQIVAGSPGDIEVTSATSPEGAAEPQPPSRGVTCYRRATVELFKQET